MLRTSFKNDKENVDCTFIGDIMWDILVRINLNDIIYSGVSTSQYIGFQPGGIGNVAVGLTKFGKTAGLIGKIGQDILGELYLNNLKKHDIITNIYKDIFVTTSSCVSFIDHNKERSLLVFRGANEKLDRQEIEKSFNLLRGSKYIYFNGYSLSTKNLDEPFFTVIEYAKKFNKKIMFDPGAYNIIRKRREIFLEILNNCDVVSLNYLEAKTLTKKVKVEKILEELLNQINFIALKLGKDGCILVSKETKIQIPSYKVRCIDTTGAGDAFNSALLFGLLENLSLPQIGKVANWFASKVITSYGARSFPSSDEVHDFLLSQRIPS